MPHKEDFYQRDFKASHHNTTTLMGRELAKAEHKATIQEERILIIFKTSGKPLTPSDVMKHYDQVFPMVPITSIRRAISNLTKQRKLYKTPEKKDGLYGVPEHFWVLRE